MKNFQQTPKQRRVVMTKNKQLMAAQSTHGKGKLQADARAMDYALMAKEQQEYDRWMKSIHIG